MSKKSSLSMITTGKKANPPRIVIYATEGMGKSTFGASATDPIVIPTEDGLDQINVAKFPLSKTFEEVKAHIKLLMTSDHEYKTCVIDSIDWLETLIWDYVCRSHNKPSIEAFGFQQGYGYALDEWVTLLKDLSDLRDTKGMAIILIAHADVRRVDNPEMEPYDQFTLKLHKKSLPKVKEWCDALLFVNHKVYIEKDKVGFGGERTRATGGGERVLYSNETPFRDVKSRYTELPDEIPFTIDEKTGRSDAWDHIVKGVIASHNKGKKTTKTEKESK